MSELSDEVVKICTTYLGPATETFLQRQTKAHMNGLVLQDLKKEHLPELLRWIGISASLIIKDKAATLVRVLETLLGVKANK